MNTSLLILNFTHPLTSEQVQTIERLAGVPLQEVRDIPVKIDPIAVSGSLAEQVAHILDSAKIG